MLTLTLVDLAYAGSVYALFAFGYALTYGVTGTFNFAHALVFGIGAWAAAFIIDAGHPLWVAVAGGAAAGGVAGVIVDRVALWPARLRGGGSLGPGSTIVSTVAVLALFLAIMDGHDGRIAATLHGASKGLPALHAGATLIAGSQWSAAAMCLAALAVCYVLLSGSRLGAGIRAIASNPSASQTVGISVEWIVVEAAFVAGACGALAGIAFYSAGGHAYAMSFVDVQFAGLAAVALGGLGSPSGAVVAGYAIAAAELGAAAELPGVGRVAIACAIAIAALAFLPGGLMRARSLRPTTRS